MIKRKIKDYLQKKSKLGIASDILFVLLLIALAFPTSRMKLLVFVKELTLFQPDIIDKQERKTLSETDYNWLLKDMNGQTISLKEMKGKTIFINFWATWCPPCIAEMPSIQQLYRQFENNPQVAFLLVSNEKPEKISRFMQKHQFSLPIYSAMARSPQIFASASIPVSFIVSPAGEIVVKKTGSAKWHGNKMIDLINELNKN